MPAPLRLHMFGGIAVHNYHPFAYIYIYVHPLSPLLPINKRAVPQRGEGRKLSFYPASSSSSLSAVVVVVSQADQRKNL